MAFEVTRRSADTQPPPDARLPFRERTLEMGNSNPMKPSSCLLAAILCSAGTLTAAEGVSTDWTEVSAADLNLMGDYQGEWLDAPRGHYFNINKPLHTNRIP